MKRYTLLLFVALFMIGCEQLRRDKQKSQEEGQRSSAERRSAPASNVTPLPRFQSVGNNPEIALDTQSGRLCRTVAAQRGSTDRYAKLPMCNREEPPLERVSIDERLWNSATIAANCYRTKNLLPWVLAADANKKEVIPGCLIDNLTDQEQPLDRTDFGAVLRLPDGTMYLRQHVYLASSEKKIPPKGRVEGGLWIDHRCDVGQPDADCLDAALMGATDLLLTNEKAGIRYRVRMDRDTDPLGIRK
jgi:hypothetical protein